MVKQLFSSRNMLIWPYFFLEISWIWLQELYQILEYDFLKWSSTKKLTLKLVKKNQMLLHRLSFTYVHVSTTTPYDNSSIFEVFSASFSKSNIVDDTSCAFCRTILVKLTAADDLVLPMLESSKLFVVGVDVDWLALNASCSICSWSDNFVLFWYFTLSLLTLVLLATVEAFCCSLALISPRIVTILSFGLTYRKAKVKHISTCFLNISHLPSASLLTNCQ